LPSQGNVTGDAASGYNFFLDGESADAKGTADETTSQGANGTGSANDSAEPGGEYGTGRTPTQEYWSQFGTGPTGMESAAAASEGAWNTTQSTASGIAVAMYALSTGNPSAALPGSPLSTTSKAFQFRTPPIDPTNLAKSYALKEDREAGGALANVFVQAGMLMSGGIGEGSGALGEGGEEIAGALEGEGGGEIAVAFKPGGMGHNKVGVRLAGEEEMQWFHMTRTGVPAGKGTVLATPLGEFGSASPPTAEYLTASTPVSSTQAEAALAQALKLQGQGEMWYILGARDCASTTRSVVGAAGLRAPVGTFTPSATFQWFRGGL